MARDDHLPIWKDAVALAVLLEEVVRHFSRTNMPWMRICAVKRMPSAARWWWPMTRGTDGWSRSSGWC